MIGYPSPAPALEAATEAPSPVTVEAPRRSRPRSHDAALEDGSRRLLGDGLAASNGAQADTEPPNGAAAAAGRGHPEGAGVAA